jgi:hypothetical protein
MDYLAEAKNAVEKSHGVTPIHLKTVPVREMFQGKIAWDGEVEVFAIDGHEKAKRCYAWGYANEKRGGKYDFVTVLEIPPVVSPQTAVKAAIAANTKLKARI